MALALVLYGTGPIVPACWYYDLIHATSPSPAALNPALWLALWLVLGLQPYPCHYSPGPSTSLSHVTIALALALALAMSLQP